MTNPRVRRWGPRRGDVLGVCSSEITIGVNMRGEMAICQEVEVYHCREETTEERERESDLVLTCSAFIFGQLAAFDLLADRKLLSCS